ncbi:Leucine-rich repeat receptor-like serine/threonine-protein kinase BAM1 [Glycine max]|nr:Leucine-rich repeat receptor-like serine/threonine-protein kinase BAM1 [Glycine max]
MRESCRDSKPAKHSIPQLRRKVATKEKMVRSSLDSLVITKDSTYERDLCEWSNFYVFQYFEDIWHHLQYLALFGNKLVDNVALELGNLSTLYELYIAYYNTYFDDIPPEIENLSNLVWLDVAYCGLSGEIPTKLGKLQNLNTLFLQVSALSGSLTPELGSLKSLKSMDLSNNMLSDEVPASFAKLKNLTLC